MLGVPHLRHADGAHHDGRRRSPVVQVAHRHRRSPKRRGRFRSAPTPSSSTTSSWSPMRRRCAASRQPARHRRYHIRFYAGAPLVDARGPRARHAVCRRSRHPHADRGAGRGARRAARARSQSQLELRPNVFELSRRPRRTRSRAGSQQAALLEDLPRRTIKSAPDAMIPFCSDLPVHDDGSGGPVGRSHG